MVVILGFVIFIMFLAGLYLIFTPVNWRLTLNKEELIHRNTFGITRKYSYSEITRVRRCYAKKAKKPNEYKIYIKKRVITVDCYMTNFNDFERKIKSRLSNAKNPIKIEGEPRL